MAKMRAEKVNIDMGETLIIQSIIIIIRLMRKWRMRENIPAIKCANDERITYKAGSAFLDLLLNLLIPLVVVGNQ